jgi:hypothetical protein
LFINSNWKKVEEYFKNESYGAKIEKEISLSLKFKAFTSIRSERLMHAEDENIIYK